MRALGPCLIWMSRIGVVVWALIVEIAMTVKQAKYINMLWLASSKFPRLLHA